MNNKGILKSHENEKEDRKHVKWDEEKLKESELVKLTITKGQICEPKTPFFHGDSAGSFDDASNDEQFYLRGGTLTDEDSNVSSMSASLSDDCNTYTYNSNSNSNNNSNNTSCCEWESEVESVNGGAAVNYSDEERRRKSERFNALRAQHYFMKNSFIKAHPSEVDHDNDGDEEEEEDDE